MSGLGYFKGGAWVEIPYIKSPPITLANVEGRLSNVERVLGKSLTHSVDVHERSMSTIILIGELNGRDFVKVSYFPPEMLPEINKVLEPYHMLSRHGRYDMGPVPRFMIEKGFR